MNSTASTLEPSTNATTEQIHSALFAHFVTGHAQMTMMLLGKFPNPQSGQIEPANPEAAKHFIDQLEMIEAKTRGNLTSDESRLLKQMLSATRLTFAEVIDAQLSGQPAAAEPPPAPEPAAASGSGSGSETSAESGSETVESTAPAAAEDDASKVKFTKKY